MIMQMCKRLYALRPHELLVALVLSTMSFACTTPSPSPLCDSNDDCQSGQICWEGLCGDAAPLPDLNPGIDCFQNADCGENARCVEGTCFQNECLDGMKRGCQTACGMGDELCLGGVWRACSAQPTTEICGTGEDEDCDSKIDENCQCENREERPCMTECGSGVERCIDSQWIGCTASRPRMEICLDPNAGVDEDCDGTIDEQCESCLEGSMPRACATACGSGQEICSGGVWRDCSAPIPSDEICNGEDDDCDGEIDEQIIRDCNNQCGLGSERCVSGAWMGCDAPENCDCTPEDGVDVQICDMCGERSRTCDTPQWGTWSMCLMGGQCTPGETEEGDCGLCGVKRKLCLSSCEWGEWQSCLDQGVCSPGETEIEDCESGCGQRTRVCSVDTCEWGEWSGCEGQNVVCTPNAVDTQNCGMCGQTRQRTCNEICQWGGWGECQSPANACTPGETEDQSCGSCETQTRVCTDQCSWGDWGACQVGSCTAGDSETRQCGLCGQQSRLCNAQCAWGEWSPCTGGGVCSPGDEITEECGIDVGACTYGSRVSTCNSTCNWDEGACNGGIEPVTESCGSEFDVNCDGRVEDDPDGFEGPNSNNQCNRCWSIAEVDPSSFTITATIDSFDDDWDYYCFEVNDNISFNPLDLNEEIQLSLTVPSNKDYDLFLYKSEADCLSGQELESSTRGPGSNEDLSWTEPLGRDDSGIYIVGVKGYSSNDYSCEQFYTLTIDGLR